MEQYRRFLKYPKLRKFVYLMKIGDEKCESYFDSYMVQILSENHNYKVEMDIPRQLMGGTKKIHIVD